jgi:hypothetical protein
MFSSPRYVLKGGRVVVEEGQLRRAPSGGRLHVRPGYDDAVLADVRRHFAEHATVQFENYPVRGVPGEPLTLGHRSSVNGYRSARSDAAFRAPEQPTTEDR